MQLKPIRSEKSLQLAGGGKYTFAVGKNYTKTEIKHAVEKTFGVNVVKTQTAVMPSKVYRTGKRFIKGTRPGWKKAVVTVKSGQKIDLFATN